MKVHLQPWYDRWLANAKAEANNDGPKNYRGDPSLGQLHFVRDNLCGVLWADVPYDKRPSAPPRDDAKETAFVVGEHRSKSISLPVYSLERPDLGIQFVLNNNYHFWQCSVITEKPLSDGRKLLEGFELDWSEEDRKRFPDGYKPGHSWGYCAFQGFPEEVQFGPYSQDCRRFSLTMGTEYQVYTFVYLIMRDLRGAGPWER